MTGKKKKRGITPWKKTALKVCVLWLLAAAGIHGFRLLKAYGFEDQREASRWGAAQSCAQVSAFLPAEEAMKEENIQELEYKINSSLAQDSIKLTAEGKDAKLWQDCYSGIGSLTLAAGSKTVTVEAVGTGGAFFTFHPLELSAGTYYLPDSIMKDEILLDEVLIADESILDGSSNPIFGADTIVAAVIPHENEVTEWSYTLNPELGRTVVYQPYEGLKPFQVESFPDAQKRVNCYDAVTRSAVVELNPMAKRIIDCSNVSFAPATQVTISGGTVVTIDGGTVSA